MIQDYRWLILLLILLSSSIRAATVCTVPTYQFSPNKTVRNEEPELFQALIVAEKSNNKIEIAKAMENLYGFYIAQDDYHKAENIGRLTIKLLGTLPDSIENQARMYMRLTGSLIFQGKYSEGQQVLSQALQNKKKLSHQVHGDLLFNKAFLYGEAGENELAIKFYKLAKAQYQEFETSASVEHNGCEFETVDPPYGIGKAFVQIGARLSELNELELAQKHLECGMDILSRLDYYYKIPARAELSALKFKVGDFNNAELNARKVLQNPGARAPQKIDAAMILLQSLLQSTSIESLKSESRRIRDFSERSNNSAGFCSISGLVTFLRNIFSVGGHFYSLDVSERVNIEFPAKLLDVYTLLIQMHTKLHQHEAVDELISTALQILEKYQSISSNPLAWRNARFALVESYVSSVVKDQASFSEQQVDDLLLFIEEHYSIAPNTERSLYAINHTNNEALATAYGEWLEAERKFYGSGGSRSAVLRQKVDLAKDAFLSLNSRISPNDLHGIKPEGKPVKEEFELARQRISGDSVIFRYVVNDASSFVIVLDNERINILNLPSKDEINKIIKVQTQAIHNSRRLSSQQEEKLREVFPFYKLAENINKIVIVADDIIHLASLPAVNISKSSNQYQSLISRFELVFTPSIVKYYSGQPHDLDAHTRSLSIFSNPTFSGVTYSDSKDIQQDKLSFEITQLPNLQGTETEAKAIKNLFDFQTINAAEKYSATKSFLMDEFTRNSQILHIATHGFYDPRQPELVGLLTASTKSNGAGFLSFSELLSEPVNSRLVVLSGCDTMQGKSYKGSGVRSLTRGFLAQGAGSVIGTLWPVQDRATAYFMEKFYQYLKHTGGNTSKALRLTQNQLSKSGPYRHPKHWAGFVLTSSNEKAEQLKL